jgi:hypothetical protein
LPIVSSIHTLHYLFGLTKRRIFHYFLVCGQTISTLKVTFHRLLVQKDLLHFCFANIHFGVPESISTNIVEK